jgi:hypothetical protein
MARYANHECTDCSVVLPANELTKISVRVLDSTRKSRRFYNGVQGGLGFGSGSSETYRIRRLEVCDDCYEYRARLAKRRAFARFVGFVGIAIIIIVIVGAIVRLPALSPRQLSTAEVLQTDLIPGPDHAQVINIATPTPDTPVPDLAKDNVSSANVDSSTPPPTDNLTATEQEPSRVEPVSGTTESDRAEIAKATTTALEQGSEQRWQVGQDTGYVMVSRPIVVGLTTCRNVYSTIHSNGSETRSPNVTWCQTDGAEWIAKPY